MTNVWGSAARGLPPTCFCPPHDARQHDVGTRLRQAKASIEGEAPRADALGGGDASPMKRAEASRLSVIEGEAPRA